MTAWPITSSPGGNGSPAGGAARSFTRLSGRVELDILVPKLCLGTRLSSKLCFAAGQLSCRNNCIPKQSLGTRSTEFGNEERLVSRGPADRLLRSEVVNFDQADANAVV